MVWIPPGALVAGTPPGVLPRIADEEMPGEQVVMKGFFISIYPYPDEEGAIPQASVTQEEAEALCREDGKRLCTELEWERACKGPDNHIYEYGDRYRAEVCGTGEESRMLPSGARVGCTSDFGVRDMHGAIWEWTSSRWGRGVKGDLVTVRGGNARAGELVGRCANAMGRPRTDRSSVVGFRCCSGAKNEAEVSMIVERKPALQQRISLEKELMDVTKRLVVDADPEGLHAPASFQVVKVWYWHPIGNEELIASAGCAGPSLRRSCGVAIIRLGLDKPTLLAWASSGRYIPNVQADADPRRIWVYGGDDRSHYRRLITYASGLANTGEVQRNVKLLPPRGRRR